MKKIILIGLFGLIYISVPVKTHGSIIFNHSPINEINNGSILNSSNFVSFSCTLNLDCGVAGQTVYNIGVWIKKVGNPKDIRLQVSDVFYSQTGGGSQVFSNPIMADSISDQYYTLKWFYFPSGVVIHEKSAGDQFFQFQFADEIGVYDGTNYYRVLFDPINSHTALQQWCMTSVGCYSSSFYWVMDDNQEDLSLKIVSEDPPLSFTGNIFSQTDESQIYEALNSINIMQSIGKNKTGTVTKVRIKMGQDSDYEWNGGYNITLFDMGTDNVYRGERFCYRKGNTMLFKKKGLDYRDIVFDGDNTECVGGMTLALDPTHYYSFQIVTENSSQNTKFIIAGSANEVPDAPMYFVNTLSEPANIKSVFIQVDGIDVQNPEPQINPVIIVPGIVGTELYNGDDLIWMDLSQTFTDPNDQFLTESLNLNDQGESLINISLGNVIKEISVLILGKNIFEDLQEKLELNDYQENQNFFFFPYDWRLDLDQTKDLHKQKIDEVKAQTGKSKVNIIAHSMGGLLVKDYLNQYGKENVDKLIFVGTPHLGAPKAGKVLLEGDRFSIPWLEEDRIKEIAENSPALHELLPNQKYFDVFQGYLRKYNLFENNPLLSYTETKDFFLNEKSQNPIMFQKTEDFYSKNLDSFNFDGIETYNIVGCKTGTQSAYSFDIFGEIGQTGYSSGDGTVPLVSADYINISNQNKFYIKDGEHAELPSTDGVRDLILNILEGNMDNLADNISNDSSFCNFKGKKLTWHSPVEIHIYDLNGNHTGPIENNTIEYGIPGIDYDVMGHNKFIFLPTDDGQEYLVEAKGLEEGSFDLGISEVDNGQYLTTQIFNDVPVTISATASFAVNNLPNTTIEVEDQGKIVEVPADTTLGGELALDLTPPETKIKTEWIKNKKQNKNLQITLTATDNQSGILETAYSLDEGKTFSIYTKPIIIEKKTDKILFFSVDRAGNNEDVKEYDIDKNKPEKCKSWKCLNINKKHHVIKKIYKKLENHNPRIIKIIKNLKLRHR